MAAFLKYSKILNAGLIFFLFVAIASIATPAHKGAKITVRVNSIIAC